MESLRRTEHNVSVSVFGNNAKGDVRISVVRIDPELPVVAAAREGNSGRGDPRGMRGVGCCDCFGTGCCAGCCCVLGAVRHSCCITCVICIRVTSSCIRRKYLITRHKHPDEVL